jgi:hypothetical protein
MKYVALPTTKSAVNNPATPSILNKSNNNPSTILMQSKVNITKGNKKQISNNIKKKEKKCKFVSINDFSIVNLFESKF